MEVILHHTSHYTAAQIRYMLHLCRLSQDGTGVRSVELAAAMAVSRPSVHNMLHTLSGMDIIRWESFGLAHLTAQGLALAARYQRGYALLSQTLDALCGADAIGEHAVCTLLAELSDAQLTRLCGRGHPAI